MKRAIEAGLKQELESAAKRRADASADLRFAVLRASTWGMSQREIAEVLGVSQPAVSQMLGGVKRSTLGRGPIGRQVVENRTEIIDIARRYDARRVRVFGSVARGQEHDESDLDLLVSMPSSAGMMSISRLGDDLADLLGVSVDIVPEHLVKADALESLIASSVAL